MSDKASRVIFAAVLLFCASFAHSQVSVGMAPPIHFQFFSSSGVPLSNGKLYTYLAGTTTPQNTYVDASGVAQNPDPIPLDSTGSPSNGSTQTGIFLSNLSWKFVAYDVNNVFQWQVDNITTYFALLNTENTWTATQTFSAQIIDTLTSNQVVLGLPGSQTTLNFAPPLSNIALNFPNTADTIVGRGTTDTMTNKSLISPAIGGITNCNGPGTYENYNNVTGVVGNLASFNGTGVVITPAGATGGVTGVVCAIGGSTASVQESGRVTCAFDGAATSGHYVQISPSVAGDCHDSGASYPTTGQVLGRVVNSGASVDLFGPEIQPFNAVMSKSGFLYGPGAHIVADSATIGGGGTVTVNFTGAAQFTTTIECVATDGTAANAVKVSASAGPGTMILTGTAGDGITYMCVGN